MSEEHGKKGKGFAALDSMVSDMSPAETFEGRTVPEGRRESAAVPPPAPAAEPYQGKPSGSGGTNYWGWLVGGAALMLLFAIGASGDKNAPSPTGNHIPAPTPEAVKTTSRSATSQPQTPPAPSPSYPDIEKPPIGRDNLLAVRQIRYCQTEKIRIEAIETVIDGRKDGEVDRFNEAVGDFNSRCGEYRYRIGDLERVQRELATARDEIANRAKSEWVRSSIGLSKAPKPAASPTGAPDARANESSGANRSRLTVADLNHDERASVESSCSLEKTVNGPAAYSRCVSSRLSDLARAPRNIDLSSLSTDERESVESSCSLDKTVNGPAAYNRCVSTKLAALKNSPRNIDLSSLTHDERESVESSCSLDKTVNGPAAYNRCVAAKLSALKNAPRNIDLSGLDRSTRESIESSCSLDKTVNGPAAYNRCVTRQMRKLGI